MESKKTKQMNNQNKDRYRKQTGSCETGEGLGDGDNM